MKKPILLILILLIILASGCSQQIQKTNENESRPQEVFESWFNSTINGDWNNVFINMVDSDGNPYSENCKDSFKKSLGYRVGTQYQLNIKNISEEKQCREIPEYQRLAEAFNVSIPNGLCVIISYSAQLKYPNVGTSNEETDSFLLKVNNEWKVIIDCYKSSSTESQNLNATEEYQADKLNLTIDLPKTSFNVNETFEGKFIVENKGEPFETFILFKCRSKEKSVGGSYIPECIDSSQGLDTTFEKVIKACSNLPTTLSPGSVNTYNPSINYCSYDYFMVPGNYALEIKVYSCAQIATSTNEVNCSSHDNAWKEAAIEYYATPIKTIVKNVTVT